MFIAINENESWYLDDNIRDHTTDPKASEKGSLSPLRPDGIYAHDCRGQWDFVDTNVKRSING